jgi:hypothetical protein
MLAQERDVAPIADQVRYIKRMEAKRQSGQDGGVVADSIDRASIEAARNNLIV